MSISLLQERPPYIEFKTEAIEDRNASIEHGRYIAKDVDFVYITPSGTKERIPREVTPWLAEKAERARQGMESPQLARYFAEAYEGWKKTREIPLDGTPIKTWSVLSPSECENLLSANVRTVEDLAAANEGMIDKIGMGARALKEKAITWLKSASGDGAVAQENAALRVRIDALEARIVELTQAAENDKPKRGRPRLHHAEDMLLES